MKIYIYIFDREKPLRGGLRLRCVFSAPILPETYIVIKQYYTIMYFILNSQNFTPYTNICT